MAHAQLLIVHPNPSAMSLLTSMLRSLGHPIEEAENDRVAVRRVEKGGVDVLIAGVDPSDPDGLELLSYVRRKQPGLPVLVVMSGPHSEREREAGKLGAAAILRYPMPAGELRAAVLQAIETRGIDSRPSSPSTPHSGLIPASASSPRVAALAPAQTSEPARPKIEMAPAAPPLRPVAQPVVQAYAPPPAPSVPSPYDDPHHDQALRTAVVGNAPAVRQAVDIAATIAPTMTPPLIVGDQGTGKSLLARSIHRASPRSGYPFVEVVCVGLDEPVLERELFGQKIRSVDASIDRPGKVERARGGTLFIDEVAALSPGLQLQLLRLLQDGEYEPQGSREVARADVRVIVATQENLPLLVEQGKFRRDLYDQISIVCLKLPPLRERGLDVERLAEHFRERFAAEFAKSIVGFAPDALEALARHEWTGNVRELESVIQRGVALCHGPKITAANLALGYGHNRISSRSTLPGRIGHLPFRIRPLKEALEEPEKQIIIQALQALNWNRQETARVLDINRTTLYKKMKKYGLLLDELPLN